MMESLEETGTISNIRQKALNSGHAFRVKRREELHAAHRQNLNEVAQEIKLPALDEIYKLSIQLKKKKNLRTLHKLRMGLSEGGESIKIFLNCDGALHSLVGCLTGFSAEIEKEALNVFINLGLGTPEQCLEIFKPSSVYFAVRMKSNYSESQSAVAWCFGNMCLNSLELCTEIASLGIDSHLQELLESPVLSIFQSVTYALTHYYATIPYRLRQAQIEKVVHQTLNGLERHDDAVNEASWFMFVLSCDPFSCEYLLHLGVISTSLNKMQQLINQENLAVSPITALLRVLLNCIGTHPQSALQVCSRADQFISISTTLLYSSYPHLHHETLQFIANVINGASQLENVPVRDPQLTCCYITCHVIGREKW